MSVLNSNSKFSAHPDLATNLLQILIPAILNSLAIVSKRTIYTSAYPRRWFVRKIFGYDKLPVQNAGKKGPG